MPDRRLAFSVTPDDCEMQVFRAGGNGGQHQNKTSSAVRFIHHPSGARGESREHRSQLQNKKAAFLRMAETQKFKLWVRRTLWNVPSPEEQVEKDMQPENLRTEHWINKEWVES